MVAEKQLNLNMSPEKVFIVDDDEAARELFGILLEDDGHKIVLEAGSLPEALEKVEEIKGKGVSVAIIDGSLTRPRVIDGNQVAEAIRRIAPEVKIIGFSGEEVSFGDVNLLKKIDEVDNLRKAVGEKNCRSNPGKLGKRNSS